MLSGGIKWDCWPEMGTFFIHKNYKFFFKVLSYHQRRENSIQEYLHLIHDTSSHTKIETVRGKDTRDNEFVYFVSSLRAKNNKVHSLHQSPIRGAENFVHQ